MQFISDLRYAVRTLARMRGAGIAAVLTLGLGIGVATTMLSVVYAATTRALPFSDPDRLAVLFTTQVTSRDGVMRVRWSWPRFNQLQAATTSFDAVASFTGTLVAVSGGEGAPEQTDGEVVSSSYFRALGVTPIAGRTFHAQEDTAAGADAVVVVSARLWRTRFAADPGLVNKTVRVNGVPLTVVGILPETFAGLTGKSQLWIPPPMAARLTYADYLTTPQNFISVVGRLKTGLTIERANAELASLVPRLTLAPGASSSPTTSWGTEAVALDDVRVEPELRRTGLVLLGAALCVLLIACVNVANLLLARARMRQREMAVRLAIGSTRGRLIRLLLTEGLVLAGLGGMCGTVLAAWGVSGFARLAPDAIPSGRNNYLAVAAFGRPALDLSVLWIALAIAAVTVVLFALVPALSASRPDLVTAFKDNDRGSGRQRRTLSTLVVTEVALASLLVTTSGLLIEHVARLQARKTGFATDNVVTFWVRPPTSRYVATDGPAILTPLLERIRAVPGVDTAALNRCTPFTGCARTLAFFPGRPNDPANAPVVGRHYISPDYFRTLDIPLLEGRALTDGDRTGAQPVAVVNQSGARRFWPGESALGKRVWFGSTTGPFADRQRAVEVVGIVGDVKYEGVDQRDSQERAEFYTSYLQFSYSDSMFIVKARGDAQAIVPELRRAVAAVDPSLPIYDVMTLDERIGAAVARPRFNAALLTAFAAAALLLAAIGVYGVLSYSVSSRLREIGVRLALGADSGRVIRLVLANGVTLALAGGALGLVASLAISGVVQSLVYGVSASDPRRLFGVIAIMTMVAAAAAFIPARRASRVDPVDVLRNE